MAVVARVYDADNATLIATLSTDWARKWLEELCEAGGGGVTVPKYHADAAALAYEQVVRMRLDGVDRFAWRVEARDRVTITAGEESAQTVAVSGRGLLAVLEDAVVYPPAEWGEFVEADYRVFNFASFDYDDSAWPAATQIKRQDGVGGTIAGITGQWDGSPAEWPDPLAYWIWSRAQVAGPPPQPVGDSYFRKTFTLAVEESASIFVTADDGYEVWLDGVLIARETEAFMWGVTRRHDVLLRAGDHLLAVKGTNITRDAVAGNVAGVILSLVRTDEGGSLLGTVILRTDSSWLALDYPDPPPGMTVGEIYRVLVDEAQARGWHPTFALGFDDVDDTDATAWEPLDIQFQIGRSLLDVTRQLCEVACDVRMRAAGLVLDAWARAAMGADVSGAVDLLAGVHLTELRHVGHGPGANTALTRLHTGRYASIDDLGAAGVWGLKETFISAGSAPSDAAAERVAQSYFRDNSEPRDAVTFTAAPVVGGPAPYVDYTVGDTIGIPDADDLPAVMRLVRLGYAEPAPAQDGAVGGTPVWSGEGLMGDEGGS